MSSIPANPPTTRLCGPRRADSAAAIVCVATGLLLIAAGVLKAQGALRSPTAQLGPLVQAHAELALGLWLLSGLRAWAARLTGIVTFIGFACYASIQMLVGAESCGCFGRLAMPPWATLIVDVAALSSLVVIARPTPTPNWRRWRSFTAAVLGLGTTLFVWASQPQSTVLTATIAPGPAGSLVVLKPQSWIGQELPLLGYLSPQGASLTEGEWVVLLYHEGCPSCSARLKQLAERGDKRLAVVHLDGSDAHSQGGAGGDGPLRLSLPARWQWFAETPIVIHIAEGIVQAVQLRDDPQIGQAAAPPPATAPTLRRVAAICTGAGIANVDLGYVTPETTLDVVIELPLGPDAPAAPAKVVSECACLRVLQHTISHEGQVAQVAIQLAFDAPAEVGPYEKPLVLLPADPQDAPLTLRVRARVGLPLSVAPTPLRLDDRSNGQLVLEVRNEGSAPVRLLYATAVPNVLTVAIPSEPVPALGRLQLHALVKSELNEPQAGLLRIVTASAQQPSIEVPFE